MTRQKKYRSERQLLDEECVELLKYIVRLRDKGCVTPHKGCHGYLCASHWKPRGQKQVKYDLRNVNCQCQACNGRHNRYTSFYDTYMHDHYGEDVCKELNEKASVTNFKFTVPELITIRDGLKEYYDELTRSNNPKDDSKV